MFLIYIIYPSEALSKNIRKTKDGTFKKIFCFILRRLVCEGRTLFFQNSACFSKVINQMKKEASNQLEDVLKMVCLDIHV